MNKISLSYHVSPNRDIPSAIKTFGDVLPKVKELLEELTFAIHKDLTYILVQHYFTQRIIDFDMFTIINIMNDTPTSKEYSPLLQIVVNLYRRLESNYRATTTFRF